MKDNNFDLKGMSILSIMLFLFCCTIDFTPHTATLENLSADCIKCEITKKETAINQFKYNPPANWEQQRQLDQLKEEKSHLDAAYDKAMIKENKN